MARREISEINAGSMADIAFLLLIFFLVTTTMEVDAGISRTLPLKLDIDVPPQPPVHDRNILVIMANSNDQLFVEGQIMNLEEMEEKVYDFFQKNNNESGADIDPTMPKYSRVDRGVCMSNIAKLKEIVANNPDDVLSEKEIAKWETKLKVIDLIGGSYMEINKSAIIQLKNQSNTSYGLYIEIQNVLKRVVNDLRQKKCDEYGWGSYLKLDEKEPADAEKIEALRILVPERIIEAKIDR